jgi:hypothetical protein
MKKSLIALAALAATSAAFAQSSVTLFGVVDLAYENVKTNAGRISGLSPSANSSSRIGFRGVEDLGGGMSASFWLEGALAPMNGSSSSGLSVVEAVEALRPAWVRAEQTALANEPRRSSRRARLGRQSQAREIRKNRTRR